MTTTATPADQAALRLHAARLRTRADSVRAYARRLHRNHEQVRWEGPARRGFDRRLEERVPGLQSLARHLDLLADQLDGTGVRRVEETPSLRAGLHYGDRGSDVAALQRAVLAAGGSVGSAGVDGIFGPDTRAGLAALQRRHGIRPANGILTAATIAALGTTRAAPRAGARGGGGGGGNGGGSASGADPRWVSELPPRLRPWWPMVERAAKKHQLDPALVLAVMDRESGGRNIRGDGGHGRGLMQIDDRSHGRFLAAHDGGLDPASNIDYGSSILAANLRNPRFAGHPAAAIAAYNCGPGNVVDVRHPDARTAGGDYSSDVLARTARIRAGRA